MVGVLVVIKTVLGLGRHSISMVSGRTVSVLHLGQFHNQYCLRCSEYVLRWCGDGGGGDGNGGDGGIDVGGGCVGYAGIGGDLPT